MRSWSIYFVAFVLLLVGCDDADRNVENVGNGSDGSSTDGAAGPNPDETATSDAGDETLSPGECTYAVDVLGGPESGWSGTGEVLVAASKDRMLYRGFLGIEPEVITSGETYETTAYVEIISEPTSAVTVAFGPPGMPALWDVDEATTYYGYLPEAEALDVLEIEATGEGSIASDGSGAEFHGTLDSYGTPPSDPLEVDITFDC